VYPRTGSLSLSDLRDALVASGVKFNLVGFDACLMGTIETAYAMEPVADYLVASEEYEPGYGWAYTGFLSLLSEDPAVDTERLGQQIVEDFISDNQSKRQSQLTLSVIDLREVSYVYEQLGAFLASAQSDIEKDNSEFATMSKARSGAKEFCDGQIDQVDIIDLVSRTDFEGADQLTAAVKSCVKYQGSAGITGANGLAMYFPYDNTSSYASTSKVLSEIGFEDPLAFYEYFLAVMGNSNAMSYTSTSPTDNGSQSSQYAQGYSWAELLEMLYGGGQTVGGQDLESVVEDFTYEDTVVTDTSGELSLTQTSEGAELELTDDQWSTVSTLTLAAALYDRSGYVLLGQDDAVAYAESSGNPLISTSGIWLGIDGQIVPFTSHTYEERDGGYYYSGSIPAILNDDTEITIEVAWPILDFDGSPIEGDSSTGYVLGYRLSGEETSTVGRGYHTLQNGDTLTFVFERYDTKGNATGSVALDDAYIVTSQDDISIDYVDLSEYRYSVACWGVLTDIYHNVVYTETVYE